MPRQLYDMRLLKLFRNCYSALKKKLYREENEVCRMGYIMLMARIAGNNHKLKAKIFRKVRLDCASIRCDYSMLLYATCMAEWFWKTLDASLCIKLPILYMLGIVRLGLVGLGTQSPKIVVTVYNSSTECDIPSQCDISLHPVA
jgi:hypothetical protein